MATSPMPNQEIFAVPGLNLEQVEDLLKLQKAAQKISSILDLDELIDKVVNEVAASFGCIESNLYLYEPEREALVVAGVCGCTHYSKGHYSSLDKGMIGYAARTRQMRYAPDVSKDPYYMACEPSTQSELSIPLLVEDQLIGVFTASHHALDAFPPHQVRSLQSLCSHIAVAVNNARLFQRERRERERMDREAEEARVIQQALLPKASPYLRDFAISGLTVSAGAVGGDWYDFIPFDDGRLGLVLADVSGKGMGAALLMSATRGMIRSMAQMCCSPARGARSAQPAHDPGFPNRPFRDPDLRDPRSARTHPALRQCRTSSALARARRYHAVFDHRIRHAAGTALRRILGDRSISSGKLQARFLQRWHYRSQPSRRRIRIRAPGRRGDAARSLAREHPR